MARCFDASRIARPSLRTCIDPDLLSTPHPALRATFPASRRRGRLADRLQLDDLCECRSDFSGRRRGCAKNVRRRRSNTDQNEAYGKAIRALKPSGELATSVEHRQVEYLDNRLEADRGALKRGINPTRGFKTLPTASATIKGFEVMRMIRKRQCLILDPGVAGEVRFVNRLFRFAA